MSSDQSHGRLTSVWPSHSYKVLSFVVYLIVAAALNHIVASRAGAAYQDVRHPQWQSPAWSARIYLFLAFLASFLLIILSGVLQFGIGLSDTETVCHAAVVICDILYVSTKIFICGFLLDRAFIVSGFQGPRLQSRQYRFQLALLAFAPVGLALIILASLHQIGEDGQCRIGFKRWTTVLVLRVPRYRLDGLELTNASRIWELTITSTYTAFFAIPLWRAYVKVTKLRRLAIESVVCSLAAMITSSANLTVLLVVIHEAAFVCLSACTVDIAINILIVAWITRKRPLNSRERTTGAGTTFVPAVIVGSQKIARSASTTIFDVYSDRATTNPVAPWEQEGFSYSIDVHKQPPPLPVLVEHASESLELDEMPSARGAG